MAASERSWVGVEGNSSEECPEEPQDEEVAVAVLHRECLPRTERNYNINYCQSMKFKQIYSSCSARSLTEMRRRWSVVNNE